MTITVYILGFYLTPLGASPSVRRVTGSIPDSLLDALSVEIVLVAHSIVDKRVIDGNTTSSANDGRNVNSKVTKSTWNPSKRSYLSV